MAAIKPGSRLTVNRSRAFQSLLRARNEWYIKRSDALERYCHGYRMPGAISFLTQHQSVPSPCEVTEKRERAEAYEARTRRKILSSLIQHLIAVIIKHWNISIPCIDTRAIGRQLASNRYCVRGGEVWVTLVLIMILDHWENRPSGDTVPRFARVCLCTQLLSAYIYACHNWLR